MNDRMSEFWSKVAGDYDRVVDLQLGGRTRFLLRERLDSETGLGEVVEFGCGTGFFTPTLAGKASKLVATDLSPGMLALARERASAPNVTFQIEDCQNTSFEDGAFDTAFLGLVLHFTEPSQTLKEMHRIVRSGGTVIVANLDPQALSGFARLRALVRVLFQGIVGYRVRPPKRSGRNMLTEKKMCDLLKASGFDVLNVETVSDPSRTSSIPVEYVRARQS